MLDIFGNPDWLALASGFLGDLIRGLLEGLNWILLVLPFTLAASIANSLRSTKVPRLIVATAAVLAIGVPFAAYYFLYPYIHFPYWMRWIPR